MIVTEQKPFEEILEILKPYSKIAISGCAGCATFYSTGGMVQVKEVEKKLKDAGKKVVTSSVIARHCSFEMMDKDPGLKDKLKDADAVLSMACGVGVQVLAKLIPSKIVVPGLNTKFIGAKEGNIYLEQCIACGNCILHTTGAICPITKCPKSDMNGPCGGVYNGKCETDKKRDCAWILIYNKLRSLGQLDQMRSIRPMKDFSLRIHPRQMEAK